MRVTIDQIEQQLAQTQCTECGFEGCGPYAEALVRGNTPINLCRPGGEEVVAKLATLLDIPVQPPEKPAEDLQIAHIEQDKCIGCTICVQVCPTDAFIGAPKMMHGLVEDDCTGCKLCVPVCPTHCISMVPAPNAIPVLKRADDIKALVDAKKARRQQRTAQKLAAKKEKKDTAKKGISAEQWAKIEAARNKLRKKYAQDS